MEVTKKNFRSLYPQLVQDIHRSVFISFDQEMSGVYKEGYIRQRRFESLEELYLKHRKLTQGFLVIQFRLTCFYKDDTSGFLYRSYNFYINSDKSNAMFHVAGDAMSYLADNGFDFKKWISEGVPYCDAQDENQLLKDLYTGQSRVKEDYLAALLPNREVTMPVEYREFMVDIKHQIEGFVKDSTRQELLLGTINSYKRIFVHQLLEASYVGVVEVLNREIGDNKMRLQKCVSSLAAKEAKQLWEKKREKVEDQIGMRRVFKELGKSKKLLVGHNMFVGLMYIVRQFFQPLPADYQEYKRFLHDTFPNMIDTKYLCKEDSTLKKLIKSTAKDKLLQRIMLPPFTFSRGNPEGEEYGFTHERSVLGAGSLNIGLIFIALAKFWGVDFAVISKDHPTLKSFVNKLFVNLNHDHDKTMVLGGVDPNQDRSLVFFAEFPKDWHRANFSEFGFKIIFLSESTGFLAWTQPNQDQDPFTLHPDLHLSRYDEYVRALWQ